MRVALVLSSGFKRLAPHVGALRAYFDTEKKGQVPHPHFITGASAGAIASAACLPWTEENFERITNAIINLNKSNIYSMWHLTELFGALTLGESFLSFIPALDHDFMKTRRGQILLESGRAGLSLITKISLFVELLKQPSIFSSEPLRRLLKKQLDFKKIWDSDIKMEIPGTDLKKAEMYYFTNYLSEHQQSINRNDQLVDAIRGSASVAAFLPAIQLNGQLLDDAAILNNIPIDRAIQAGCEVIFVIMHRPYLEKIGIRNNQMSWVDELNRAMDLAIGHHTDLTLRWHQEINHDLEIIETMKDIMTEMPENPKIAQLKILLKQLSAYGQTKTKVIPVFCEQSLPSLTFNKFDPESLRKGYELGYQTMKQTLESMSFS